MFHLSVVDHIRLSFATSAAAYQRHAEAASRLDDLAGNLPEGRLVIDRHHPHCGSVHRGSSLTCDHVVSSSGHAGAETRRYWRRPDLRLRGPATQ